MPRGIPKSGINRGWFKKGEMSERMKGNKHCSGKKNVLGKHWKIKNTSKMKGNIYWKGKHHSQKTKEKMREAHEGKKTYEMTEEIREKMSKARQGTVCPLWVRKKLSEAKLGMKNPSWKGGIDFRKKNDERNDSAYQEWVKQVKKRDNNQCIFKGRNCSGYCIVHHILSWKDFSELRYNVNNGITLCQFHHPRKRVEEQRLIPFFKTMVGLKAPI